MGRKTKLDAAKLAAGFKRANLKDARDTLESAKRSIARIKAADYLYLSEIMLMGYTLCEKLISFAPWINTDLWGEQHLRITMRAVDGLKSPGLVAFLAYLDAEFTEASSRDYTSKSCAERTFRFSKMGYSVELNVTVPDSSTCRKIQTGVKVEEVPVYQIVCD